MATVFANRLLTQAPRMPWLGTVYRAHGPNWSGDDPGGSLVGSGRWNIGKDHATNPERAFPVLYSATDRHVASGEFTRHSYRDESDVMWNRLRVKITKLEVALPSVLDLRQPEPLGIPSAVFTSLDYEMGQAIALTAYDANLSGLLVPTATGLGVTDGHFNVILFFEATGNTSTSVFGFTLYETLPREGIRVRVVSSEQLNLPPAGAFTAPPAPQRSPGTATRP